MRNEILFHEAVFIWPFLRVLPLVAANGLLLFGVRIRGSSDPPCKPLYCMASPLLLLST